jgi:thiol-disulfide isomerase/thioredoxin
MNMYKKYKNVLLLILLLTIFGCGNKEKNAEDNSKKNAENVFTVSEVTNNENLAPEFTWENAAGTQNDFDSYRGQLTIVNFWATWCSPCKKEIPYLIAMGKDFEPWGLKVLGISIDRGRNVVVDVSNFVKEYKINYDIIIDDGSLQKAFGNVRGVPVTFFIGKDGRILDSFAGIRPKEVFVAKINQYLQ